MTRRRKPEPSNEYVTNRELAAKLETVNVKIWLAIVFAGGNLVTNAVAIFTKAPTSTVALLERVFT